MSFSKRFNKGADQRVTGWGCNPRKVQAEDAGPRIQINEELESKFREATMRKFGYGKGSLSRAAEEALQKWLLFVGVEDHAFEGDAVEALDGLLADLNLDSVVLQHLMMKKWVGELLGNVSS